MRERDFLRRLVLLRRRELEVRDSTVGVASDCCVVGEAAESASDVDVSAALSAAAAEPLVGRAVGVRQAS
jgi:hypothetical protein